MQESGIVRKRSTGQVFRSALGIVAAAGIGAAQAQDYSNFRVQPNPARAGQPVELVVNAAWCDYLPRPRPAVRIVDDVVIVEASDSDACFGVGGTARSDLDVPLGSFAEGHYRMRFVGTVTQTQLAEVPFGVIGADATPNAVPAGGGFVALAMAALLAFLAACGLRSHIG